MPKIPIHLNPGLFSVYIVSVMIFKHNNLYMWVQTTFVSLWLYSVASNQLEKWCTHQTTYLQ